MATVDLAFLSGEDDDFTPNLTGKVDDLSDGDYDFCVKDSTIKVLDAKSMAILETKLEVLSPGKHQGMEIQHAWFVKDKDGMNRVGKDLSTLGFDVEEWTKANGRPFTLEFPNVPKVLKGLRFKAKKQTNAAKDGGKTYHNLYINKRDLTDGKPARLGAEQLHAEDPDSDPF